MYEVHPAEEPGEYVVVNSLTGRTRCSFGTEHEAQKVVDELNEDELNEDRGATDDE